MKSLQELTERDVAFRERRPDPYAAPRPEGWEVWILPAVYAIAFLFVVAVAHHPEPPDTDSAFLAEISRALARYEAETGSYPVSEDGDSAVLFSELSKPDRAGKPYLNPADLPRNAGGQLQAPSGAIVRYCGRSRYGRDPGFQLLTLGPPGVVSRHLLGP